MTGMRRRPRSPRMSVFFTHLWSGKYAQDFPFLISYAYGSGPVDASKNVLRSGLKIPLLHFE
jgi:hypothetical protein